ncbi:MAG: nicotinamide-nucleotide amidohydrolase family protein [Nitrospirae bacterium]|nr:nicotinamide-nucleotide amidohydrolase family protein [Candidatus Manganitrophaceae bacterium]
MTEISATLLRWGTPRIFDSTVGAPFGALQRTLYRSGVEKIEETYVEEEAALEGALRTAAARSAVVCVAATDADGAGWAARLDVLRGLMAKVSRKRLTLSAKTDTLLPGGTETVVDPEGAIPLFLLPFSLPHSSRPTLLIITPGGEAVLEHLRQEIEKQIQKVFGPQAASRWVGICGVAPGDVLQWVGENLAKTAVEVKSFPAIAGVDLLFRSRDPLLLNTAMAALEARWGPSCYSWEGETLEEVVGRLLLEKQKWLAIAESCTGGRIAARITRIPGSSRYFDSASITYSNRSKETLLGVPSPLLQEKGAVSAEVAHAMAEGIRQRQGVDLGLSVTGIAGPGGGTEQKPVGLVYIALSDGRQTTVDRFLFRGDRETIQAEAAQRALDRLRRHLIGTGDH